MKKTFILMATALIMALAMQAQDVNASRHHRGHGPAGDMDPQKMVEMRVKHLDKELSLTSDQKDAITRIYTEEANEMKEMMAKHVKDEKGTKPDKSAMDAERKVMQERRQATDAKVEALLNADQKARFAQIKERKPRHHGDRKKERAEKNGKGGTGCGNGCGESCGAAKQSK